MRSRKPRRLLLALFGEHVAERRADEAVRAAALIDILEPAGVGAAAVRAALDRVVASGLLVRERQGREIAFRLTPSAVQVLREASGRVHAERPFAPQGEGWTLVTFTLPERHRELRHRLRAALTWQGFALLRDGLWMAPGEVDLGAALAPLREQLPADAVTAFRAQEMADFPIAAAVRGAWDLDAIRAEHEAFLEAWEQPVADTPTPLTTQIMLVADWLALLRADPRLPAEYLGTD